MGQRSEHLGVKLSQCYLSQCCRSQCYQIFPKASLYFHLFKRPNQKAVHKKIRNHICSVCGHAFAQKTALRQHMFIHTGESDHKCKFCGKMFASNYRLEEHEVK